MARRYPLKDFQRFRHLVHDHFTVALADYAFAEASTNVWDPGMWVNLRNTTTEVNIYFEYESGVSVKVHRLIPSADGMSLGQGYGLGELLEMRAPGRARPVIVRDFDETAIAADLTERATALKQYGDDILRGDFSAFPELARLRAERLWSESMRIIDSAIASSSGRSLPDPYQDIYVMDAVGYFEMVTGIDARVAGEPADLTAARERWHRWKERT